MNGFLTAAPPYYSPSGPVSQVGCRLTVAERSSRGRRKGNATLLAVGWAELHEAHAAQTVKIVTSFFRVESVARSFFLRHLVFLVTIRLASMAAPNGETEPHRQGASGERRCGKTRVKGDIRRLTAHLGAMSKPA